jgi:hypothetical protein
MCKYGLDPVYAQKVIAEKNENTTTEPILLTKYAKIGLSNFYEAKP